MKRLLLALFSISMIAMIWGCTTAPVLGPQESNRTVSNAAISPESREISAETSDSQVDQPAGTDQDSDFIGLNLKAAEALAGNRGVAHRVISVNGKGQLHTMDYRPNRINFWLEKRKVVKATRG